MKRIITILVLWLAASIAQAQIWTATNEIAGIVSPLLYTNFVQGSYRVTVAALDGGLPVDLSGNTIRVTVEDTRDGKITTNSTTAIDTSTYRAEGNLLASPLPYTLKLVAYPIEGAAYPIYWASLTITSAPSPATVSLSLDPLIASNGTVGTPSNPWAGIAANTGAFSFLSVDNLDVAGQLSAIDTSKLALTGGTMQAPATGTWYGTHFGDGSGLTGITGADLSALSNGVLGAWATGSNAVPWLSLTQGVHSVAITNFAEADPIYSASEWATNTAGAIIAASSGGASPWTDNGTALTPTNSQGVVQLGGLASTTKVLRVFTALHTNGSPMAVLSTFVQSETVAGPGNGFVLSDGVEGGASGIGVNNLYYSSLIQGANAAINHPFVKGGAASGVAGSWVSMGFSKTSLTTNRGTQLDYPLIYGYARAADKFILNIGTDPNFGAQNTSGLVVRIAGNATSNSLFLTGSSNNTAGVQVNEANRYNWAEGLNAASRNTGRGVLTAGVCIVAIPAHFPTTNYTVMLTGIDGPGTLWCAARLTNSFTVSAGADVTNFEWFARGVYNL